MWSYQSNVRPALSATSRREKISKLHPTSTNLLYPHSAFLFSRSQTITHNSSLICETPPPECHFFALCFACSDPCQPLVPFRKLPRTASRKSLSSAGWARHLSSSRRRMGPKLSAIRLRPAMVEIVTRPAGSKWLFFQQVMRRSKTLCWA